MARMSPTQRLVAVLVAMLVLGGVVVLGLSLADPGPGTGVGPSVSPSLSASASASADQGPGAEPSGSPATDAPSASGDADTQAVLAEIEEQVIAIRGLEAAEIGPAEIISRDQLAEELETLFEEQYPAEERARDNVALRALGLLEPGQDVAELQLELLGDSVLGFYDDVRKRMVVVSDAGLDVEARITYAHEYTHALQDAAFDFDTLEIDAAGEDDRGLARSALREGDATTTMLAWMFQHLGQEEILQYISGAEVPDTTGIPSWMVAQLTFPYEAGLNFTNSLAGGDPTSPDFTDIDHAYEAPPESTEQIIDPDKWDPREVPDRVDVPDLAGALGDGWEEVDSTPIGQAAIEITLEHFGVSAEDAGSAGEGWGGDRAVIASGPDDAFAVAWRLAWDSPSDADEFLAAYETVVDELAFPASVTELAGGEILVAHASTDALLAQTVDAAD
jgi:hypothetical protein